jgi:hypothetical protein
MRDRSSGSHGGSTVTQAMPFSALISQCQRSAVHLETRDQYMPRDPVYLDWLAGKDIDAPQAHRDWYDLVRATVARGVCIRRARVVSEPVTDYIRHEHWLTSSLNIAAGERVRWLPRRRASDLALPGNDFWLLDDRLVRFIHFAGDGEYLCDELTDDAAVAALCSRAFEQVWERATDHRDFRLA